MSDKDTTKIPGREFSHKKYRARWKIGIKPLSEETNLGVGPA